MAFRSVPDLTSCEDFDEDAQEAHRLAREQAMLDRKPPMGGGSERLHGLLDEVKNLGPELLSAPSGPAYLIAFYTGLMIENDKQREELLHSQWLLQETMRELREGATFRSGGGPARPNLPDFALGLTKEEQNMRPSPVEVRAHPGADSSLEKKARQQRDACKARYEHLWLGEENVANGVTFNKLPLDVRV